MRPRSIANYALWMLAACASIAQGQAPSISDVLVGRKGETENTPQRSGAGGPPPSSAWLRVGAQMGYLLDGSGTIEDDFLASGRVEMTQLNFGSAQPAGFRIPIISNVGALGLAKTKAELEKGGKDLLTSAKGVSLGVSPYMTFGPCRARTTLYASAAWKLNTGRDLTDTTQTVKLHQGRFSVGIGMDADIIDGSTMPLTLSVEPVYTVWNAGRYRAIYGVDRTAITSLELTAILPINSIGLLAQTNVAQAMTPSWRIGLLLFTPSKSNDAQKAASADPNAGSGPTPTVPATGTAANPPVTTPPSAATPAAVTCTPKTT